ncbi:Uncharacterized protein TCM_030622 [Theobroma cacao]|uniref:Uncharacterized protein n=1 Tax=Theobroma cacao TaxID=3641 RepID=A0A061F3S2_THECC|nr:Uncharacterized protein TCM_030622 [Theobroma cacao]
MLDIWWCCLRFIIKGFKIFFNLSLPFSDVFFSLLIKFLLSSSFWVQNHAVSYVLETRYQISFTFHDLLEQEQLRIRKVTIVGSEV